MAKAFSIILLTVYGLLICASILFVVHGPNFRWIGLLGAVGGALAAHEEAGIVLADLTQTHARGFEVKLNPGTTHGLIEKKEE